MLTNEQLENIIDELEGTNLTLEDALNNNGLDFESIEPEDIQVIESTIFFCDECENWVFVDDESEYESGVCRWCVDDDGNDDELWDEED
jgi:hypothetical protein